MADSVPVRCPSCLRDHLFASPVYPCACGAPLAPPLLLGAPPERMVRRSWDEEWVVVRCTACGRRDHWPQPELGCPCGTLLRVPVRRTEGGASMGSAALPDVREEDRPAAVEPAPAPPFAPARPARSPRPPFRPVTIRTERDAVSVVTLYLRWLGFHDVTERETHPAEARPEGPPEVRTAATTVELRAAGLIVQVDPSTRPATLRDVECLWLNGMAEASATAFFSLAGYAPQARERADGLGVPLFVMDLTGNPQPVNGAAEELVETGA
ncbi:hypothetical protein GCM10010232_53600 [Streptomyces amakusaensis]|uniref:Restriction endonuclease type IV Mrr domain-containing protein n=1 Tax=Streptomyces amakusaensis TaxID=67271 RepID=A0ABW0AL98_9ACTN